MNDNEKYAYLAGLVDGEGSICICKSYITKTGLTRYVLRLVVTNTNLEVISWIHNNWKGAWGTQKATSSNGRWKTCYHWHIDGETNLPIIKKILPYLIIKKKQAYNAISFYEDMLPRVKGKISKEETDRRELLYLSNKQLNKRGE